MDELVGDRNVNTIISDLDQKLNILPERLSPKEHFQRIEIFYHRLRDNFLAQNNRSVIDGVMYELAWQKQEILGEWWWRLYGWFFGWGYKPWRFLAFLVMPTILIFASLWYFSYYDALQQVIFKSELEDASSLAKQEGSKFQQIWHAVFFSTSALLGIRFKKAWIIKHKKFLFWATLEWTIGIGLYIIFAVLVKGDQFAYIKGLFGF